MSSNKAKPFETFPCVAHKLHTAMAEIIGESKDFRDLYLLRNLTRKYCADSPSGARERRDRAFEKVLLQEGVNHRTNQRIMNTTIHRFRWFELHAVQELARSLIHDVLGDFSYGIYERSRFTSGAGVGYPRTVGDSWYKYMGRITCTLNAYPRIVALVRNTPMWHAALCERWGPLPEHWIRIVQGSEGFTVPKDSDVDRFACKEPTGNVLLQTAVGTHIRNRLRKVGINLNDQTRNANRAWWASLTGSDATIDLSSASDSVTLAVCQVLLPPEWYSACLAGRSPFGFVNGKRVEWEMMSSMGNGFTFELESLIFWALSEATRRLLRCPGRVLVYGDDIIVPTAVAHPLIAVLGFYGFRTNKDKTFIRGDFRESCGGHYNKGEDVTPIYIRKPITDTSRMIWFLNSLRKWAGMKGGICDPRFESLYFRLRRKYISDLLWCGVRLSSISSLAGPGEPRQRLKFISEGRRINGVAAVLRTFQFSVGHRCETKAGAPEELMWDELVPSDPQVWYEMYGTIPISSDMSRLMTVTESVCIEANREQFSDDIPVFSREI